jgi:hypothetical protein
MAGLAMVAASGRAMVSVFDGTRKPYSGNDPLLVTVTDGNQKEVHRDFHSSPNVLLTDLPVFDNFGDDYTVVVWADGYKDAGVTGVKIRSNVLRTVQLMLLPKSNELNFGQATWSRLAVSKPKAHGLFMRGTASEDAASRRYDDLKDHSGGEVLACLLNITTAMEQIILPQQTALDYIVQLMWDLEGSTAMASDRFYGWVDPEIINQIEQAKEQNKFANAPSALHPGATRSYKQVEFGEANVQITLHENDRQMVNGINCVKVELDVDYYRDPLAHLLLEVAVNRFGSITDPRAVYALRWIAGQRAGVPEFDPLFTIQKL